MQSEAPSKELTLQFIYNHDNTVSVRIKSGEEHSENELYLAYRYLYQLLHSIGFDWSIEGNINTIVKERKDEDNG